jgi:hypothetical protein
MASLGWKGFKSGILNLLEPSASVKACNGIALPWLLTMHNVSEASCVLVFYVFFNDDASN